jgi:hypothetical protein
MIRPQFENAEPPLREVLLMAQVLVADDEQVKPRGRRLAQEIRFIRDVCS